MKKITIYPTAVKIEFGVALADLLIVDGFEELLDNKTSPERCQEITDNFKSTGIDIQFVVYPDGHTDENLFDIGFVKNIIEVAKESNENYRYGTVFNTPPPKVDMTNQEVADYLSLLKLIEDAGRQLRTFSIRH